MRRKRLSSKSVFVFGLVPEYEYKFTESSSLLLPFGHVVVFTH
jgi:hypothetical protein